MCVFRFALDKREKGEKKENVFVAKRRKMNRGICRHKSVSDRLKGWNRERTDTLVGFLKWQLPSMYERGKYNTEKGSTQERDFCSLIRSENQQLLIKIRK